MMPPRYQEISTSDIPEVLRTNGTRIRIITGIVDGITGPVTDIVAKPIYLDVSVPANTDFQHPVMHGHAAFAYVYEGGGRFGISADNSGRDAAASQLVIFEDGDYIHVCGGSRNNAGITGTAGWYLPPRIGLRIHVYWGKPK